ncbi:MAG: Type II secretion system protein E [candidate division TM6 bacterium GW2011_GWE2_41_16]|nr:MAG: Type II secretion system protein E [candidate division TM6 bacterium GW2011_GWE2_41_16]
MIEKRLEQILVSEKLVSQERVDTYVAEADKEKISFEAYVTRENRVSERDIAFAYAKLYEMPFLESIGEKIADPDLMARVPMRFLRDNAIVPLRDGQQYMLATARPYDFQPIDEMAFIFGSQFKTVVASRPVILEAINKYYPLEGAQKMIAEFEEETKGETLEFEAIDETDILSGTEEAPIIQLVNHIFYQAVKRGASDIHIEPFEKEIRVRYRIDGVLFLALTPPKRAQGALSSRIKIMANLNIAEKRLPQDGRINIKVADKAIDIRVSILPVAHGERIVMRLLDKSKTFGKIERLGFSDRDLRVMKQCIEQPNGIFLVTGPTGSGKTSTLYSVLYEINTPDVNIITVEDPVEYQMAGVGQVQVREKIGLTFAAALRSILRQDPDIVMIGETRDHETAQIAIQAALTGHLVLSTLHTNSAASTITRLLDMGIEPFLISSTVVGVMAQRLVRKLCQECKEVYTPTPEALKKVGISPEEASKITFYKAKGCDECLQSGFKGRLAIFEVMVMTVDIARLTLARADTVEIKNQAVKDGMTLLVQDGVRKIRQGLTTIEEVLVVAESEEVIA